MTIELDFPVRHFVLKYKDDTVFVLAANKAANTHLQFLINKYELSIAQDSETENVFGKKSEDNFSAVKMTRFTQLYLLLV